MRYRGCAYYPEYWGVKRVTTDARLMREAGINLVRIGEFAWCRMEPEEGRFELDWLHESLDILGKAGIQALLCTPTATPPAWLTEKVPETLLVKANGERATHGGRRHYCPTAPEYRRLGGRITEVLATEMRRHRNVIGWQLDNELGPELSQCHCPCCQAAFRAWLQRRYRTTAELNRRWATGFWSHDYTAWSQVRLADSPHGAPSRNLDSRRFWSESFVDFARHQTAILRRLHPKALVVTNGMGAIYPHIDYYRLFADLDAACDDLYFDICKQDVNACIMDIFRSIKPGRAFWVTETGAGALDHSKPPHPDQFRAWAWSSFAHGAEAHLVFRWRTCLSGQEQELQGILEHSGKPRHRYRAVQRCFREFKALQPALTGLPLPKASVAIVQDYQTLWAYDASRPGRTQNYNGQPYHEVDYPGLIYRLHRELYRRQILADVVPTDRDLTGYRLLLLPSLVCIAPEFARKLESFVRGGGIVLAVGQIGIRDANNSYLAGGAPAHLQRLFGVSIEGGMYLRRHTEADEAIWIPAARCTEVEVGLDGEWAGEPADGKAGKWIGDLELRGGKALLRFTDEAYAGQPAVVEKVTGRGRTIYSAAIRLDNALFVRLVEHALSLAGVKAGPEAPEFVEVIRRGPVTFIVNHRAEPATVTLGVKGKALLGQYRDGTAVLPAYGVCVVRAIARNPWEGAHVARRGRRHAVPPKDAPHMRRIS